MSATLALRPGGELGPALGRAPWPKAPVVLSAALHVVLVAAFLLTTTFWPTAKKPKTYVINLVPSVAAVGSPQGTPALPPRAPEPPRTARTSPNELPQREVPRQTPAPEMPGRSRETPSLPDRSLPSRPSAPTLPRTGDKELPPMADTPRTPAPTTTARRDAPAQPPAPPPQPLGQTTGSTQGTAAVSVNASDFPYAYWVNQVSAKISQKWEGKAMPGKQPVALIEISRDGRVHAVNIDASSGNSYYDRAALRAVTEAMPFPPLPAEFKGDVLRLHLGFNFTGQRG